MPKNKNNDFNDFICSQMELINKVKPQLELINSIQPQLDASNSIQSQLDALNLIQPQLDASNLIQPQLAASVQDSVALSVPIDPVYSNPAILKSLEPFCEVQKQIDLSIFSSCHYCVETPAFSALAVNISNLVSHISFPIQKLYESSQKVAAAMQHSRDIASTFASNIEDITVSSEPESSSFIDLPKPVAEIFADMDDSIELPPLDSKQIVRIHKTDNNTFCTVLGLLLTLASLLYGIYSSNASTALSKQQHDELMSEEQRQTELLENIYNALDSMLNNNMPPINQKPNTEKCSHCQSDSE